ncbi:MAG: hypothetical protein P8J27_01060 [Mariniblastus sp.]|nr:hypothetical protein [Mariniblastus sp.]
MKSILTLLLPCLLVGCGNVTTDSVNKQDQPLTIQEWKQLDVAEKYEPETFDRLKLNDPKLSQDKHWDQLMRRVVVPERRKDIPTPY